jgi:hypothetical protein
MCYASLEVGQTNQHVELGEVLKVMVLSHLTPFRAIVQAAHDRLHVRLVCGGRHASILEREHLLAHL